MEKVYGQNAVLSSDVCQSDAAGQESYTFVRGDEQEAWLTSITPRYKRHHPLAI